ncbi:hypothetical protein BDQ17DRAFT_1100903 [Cyathus striatus]|nr:hypothetical protein BDQ17DRAFT_1100903 [Cyathus striatus]
MFRRALPYMVATAAGILSGVYIFRPIIDQELQNTPIRPLRLRQQQALEVTMIILEKNDN